MQKIMFNDRFGLTAAVLEGRKTMTRRIATTEEIECPNIGWGIEGKERGKRVLCSCNEILAMSRYAKGEVIAIAQAYKDVPPYKGHPEYSNHRDLSAGWENKMFVKAYLMKYYIKITDIKVERLQDCSDDDILKEGVFQIRHYNGIGYTFKGWTERGVECSSDTPKGAFKALIDKTCGRGTFESNPYVFAYSFKLLD